MYLDYIWNVSGLYLECIWIISGMYLDYFWSSSTLIMFEIILFSLIPTREGV
jgi:hypothetical protein